MSDAELQLNDPNDGAFDDETPQHKALQCPSCKKAKSKDDPHPRCPGCEACPGKELCGICKSLSADEYKAYTTYLRKRENDAKRRSKSPSTSFSFASPLVLSTPQSAPSSGDALPPELQRLLDVLTQRQQDLVNSQIQQALAPVAPSSQPAHVAPPKAQASTDRHEQDRRRTSPGRRSRSPRRRSGSRRRSDDESSYSPRRRRSSSRDRRSGHHSSRRYSPSPSRRSGSRSYHSTSPRRHSQSSRRSQESLRGRSRSRSPRRRGHSPSPQQRSGSPHSLPTTSSASVEEEPHQVPIDLENLGVLEAMRIQGEADGAVPYPDLDARILWMTKALDLSKPPVPEIKPTRGALDDNTKHPYTLQADRHVVTAIEHLNKVYVNKAKKDDLKSAPASDTTGIQTPLHEFPIHEDHLKTDFNMADYIKKNVASYDLPDNTLSFMDRNACTGLKAISMALTYTKALGTLTPQEHVTPEDAMRTACLHHMQELLRLSTNVFSNLLAVNTHLKRSAYLQDATISEPNKKLLLSQPVTGTCLFNEALKDVFEKDAKSSSDKCMQEFVKSRMEVETRSGSKTFRGRVYGSRGAEVVKGFQN